MHYNVRELAIPRIGCGLDQLNWDIVISIIDEIFENCLVFIRIFEL